MAKTIGEYLTQNGYEIGRDVIRVKPKTKYKSKVDNYTKELTMSDLGEKPDGFYCTDQGQGIGIISRPLTNEYYITQDRNLIRQIASQFNLPFRNKTTINMTYSYMIDFVDKKLQKAWEEHLEYMRPENVKKRRREKEAYDERARLREQSEKDAERAGILPMGVKDVIRQGGFTPKDYIELKEGMVDLAFVHLDSSMSPRIVKLPKEEDVSSKRYILYDGGTYMIGNTDTNEAIFTKNKSLVNTFASKGVKHISECEPLPYKQCHYGTIFEDKKLQKAWEEHIQRLEKEASIVEREVSHYIIRHLDELKTEANTVKQKGEAEADIIYGLALTAVLKQRAEARQATRNITTEYQTPEDYAKKKRLNLNNYKKELKERKKSRLAKAFREKHSQAPSYLTEQQGNEVSIQSKPEVPTKSSSVWKRLARKFGGRG